MYQVGKQEALQSTNDLVGYPIAGLTSPELQYFLWRSYRKMARSWRLFHKKLRKRVSPNVRFKLKVKAATIHNHS